jgi:hypothetical protein
VLPPGLFDTTLTLVKVLPTKYMAEGHKTSEQYLELLKLAVEMADRISARGATANASFLAVNTAHLARHQ